jgi:hypothetical protein
MQVRRRNQICRVSALWAPVAEALPVVVDHPHPHLVAVLRPQQVVGRRLRRAAARLRRRVTEGPQQQAVVLRRQQVMALPQHRVGRRLLLAGGLPLLRLVGLRRRRVAALLQPAPSDVDIAPDPAQQPLRESHLMTRAIPWTVTVFWLAASGALLPMTAKAQALAHSGSSWSGSWGFPSAPDKSLGLQTAQTVRAARVKPAQNVVTYNTDNRSNFVEYIGAQGSSFVSDFQIGDTSSSTTGSMNTGAVSILVEGENNTVTTSTSSQSTGCQDGSILSSVLGSARPLVMREDGSVVPASGAPSDEGSSLC